MKYLWWCLSDNETAADARTVEVSHLHSDDTISLVAEAAADMDHSHHDAWESSWPRRYAIQATEGDDRKVRVFDVDRRTEPVFHASAVEQCKTYGCQRLVDEIGRWCAECRKTLPSPPVVCWPLMINGRRL